MLKSDYAYLFAMSETDADETVGQHISRAQDRRSSDESASLLMYQSFEPLCRSACSAAARVV